MSVGLQARPPVDTPVPTAAPLNTIHLSRTLAADALQRFGTLPLRLFLGLTFIYAALVKIADPGYLDPTAGGAYLGNQLQGFVASSPIGFLIEAVALPQIQLVGIGVVLTELVIGLLVVGGVFTRFAAAVGALLNLQLFLTLTWNIQPYFLAPDSLYAVAWITLALVGDGGLLSLRSFLRPRRSRHPTRVTARSVLRRGQAITLAVGSTAVGLTWLLAIIPRNIV